MHSAVPVSLLNVSTGQIVHVPPRAVVPDSVPEYPVLQRQSLPPSDPAGLEELPSQLTQLVSPVAPLNFPASQMVHVPPSGPEYPALQRQEVDACLPVALFVPEFASTVEHAVQLAVPVSFLNVFSGQMVHEPPSGPE